MSASEKPRVAFVGSGGAAKGVAHIGVLKALEEVGVVPDVFVGASAGAIAAAFAVQGFSSDQMLDAFRPFWKRRSTGRVMRTTDFFGAPRLRDWLRPGYVTSGLFSIDRFEAFLAETLPTNDFRRLDRPFLVTAADIDGRGRVVFGRGHEERVTISQAVAASCCVPVLFRPYRIGDRHYIDGEVVRTLSLDLAVEAGANLVVVSNVYRPHVTAPGRRSLALEGGAAVARQALNIMLSEKERRGMDLVHRLYPHVTILNIAPDLGRFPFTSRRPVRQLILRGYSEALRVLLLAKERGLLQAPAQGEIHGSPARG